jgi:hypothetical protein
MSQYCAQACNDQLRRQRLEKFQPPTIVDSFFDLTALDIDGNEIDFSEFKGKVTIVVNVASECGECYSFQVEACYCCQRSFLIAL